MLKTSLVVAGALALVACSTDRAAAPESQDSDLAHPDIVTASQPTGIHLVRYTGGAESKARAAIAARGGKVLRQLPEIGVLYVSGLGDAGFRALSSSAAIKSIAADYVAPLRPAPLRLMAGSRARGGPRAQGTDQSSAQFYPFQWNMRSAAANTAWVPSGGGAGELVCVLDTGIDPGHLDLSGRVAANRQATVILNPRFPSDVTPLDYDFHGTFVASLITSNGIGMASVAPNAQICAIKVLSQDGRGTFGDVVAGMVLAANWNAHVINLSLGGVLDVSEPRFASIAAFVQQGVNYALSRGSLVVAAAGNLGVNFDEVPKRFINIPSMLSGVVSVGATAPTNQQNFDQLATYSNFGGIRTLDMVAPGGDLVAGGVTTDLMLAACSQYAASLPFACGATSYLFASGTSFASPMVAGAAAVVESTKGAMTTAALEACLESTADKVGSKSIFGAGRLNVFKAISCT